MNAKTFAMSLALPLSLAAVSAFAQDAPTMEPVTAVSRAEVRVDCESALWPTVRQVSRLSGQSTEAAQASRKRIADEGRGYCAAGATHVTVAFMPSINGSAPVAMVLAPGR
jgi:hypothetical protein